MGARLSCLLGCCIGYCLLLISVILSSIYFQHSVFCRNNLPKRSNCFIIASMVIVRLLEEAGSSSLLIELILQFLQNKGYKTKKIPHFTPSRVYTQHNVTHPRVYTQNWLLFFYFFIFL